MNSNSMSVGDAIRMVLRQLRLEDKLTVIGLEKTCRSVLGPDLSKWVKEISFYRGILFLDVDNASVKQELSYHKTTIRNEINQKIGKEIILEIKIK
jgi:hypothetical protein